MKFNHPTECDAQDLESKTDSEGMTRVCGFGCALGFTFIFYFHADSEGIRGKI